MLPSPPLPLLRRLVLFVGLVLLLVLAAAFPARPALLNAWPFPVEEVVLPNGEWILQPIGTPFADPTRSPGRARTRPRSLAAVELVDGSVHYGFVLERPADGEGYLLIQVEPDRQLRLTKSEVEEISRPNALTPAQRALRTMMRLLRRHGAAL